MTSSHGPLHGVRVLDLTSVVMGPYASQIMGDLGADVIAIETKAGDTNRYMGAGPDPTMSGTALNLMRNKRSVGLNLKHEAGRVAFLRIAATCDVVLTNLRPGPLARLGLAYEAVSAVRPDVIFCRSHGYPSDSDQADAPAYDDIIQSASGVADAFVKQTGEQNLAPVLIADKVSGLAILTSVLAALYHRSLTGEGQEIEVPMVDAIRSFMLVEHGAEAIPEPPVGQPGHARILTPHRRPQPTADGHVHLLPYSDANYTALFEAGGRHELLDDPRVASRATRNANSDWLYSVVADITPQRTTDEWLSFAQQHGIPATRAFTLQEIVETLPLADHPEVGPYRQVPHPVRYSATPASVRRHASGIGHDGAEVLAEVGYQTAEIEALTKADTLFSVPFRPAG